MGVGVEVAALVQSAMEITWNQNKAALKHTGSIEGDRKSVV